MKETFNKHSSNITIEQKVTIMIWISVAGYTKQ